MKDHKKLTAAVLSALMLATVACDKKTEETTTAEETTTVEETTTEETTTEETTTEATTTEETTTEATTTTEPETDFKFTEANFPKIDGSTSTKPMATAIKSLLLGIDRDTADASMEFHKTSKSFEYLVSGSADLLIVAQPSDEVFTMMEDKDFEYEMEPFALEALVFVCNSTNPVDSLTKEQIVDIYTGKITNWKEVGGNDEPITPIQRNHSSGSQVMMDKLVMNGQEMMEVEEALMPGDMGGLIDVVKGYDNSASAIGYTPYYYATSMGMAAGLKILKVDGVEPNNDTIRNNEYPYINPYYVVIGAKAADDSPEKLLYNWILSPDGQKLTEMEGYVPSKGE